jgi:Bacterial antitoxin of ParD toxin-antitoxin type II system and RHH
MTMNLPLPPQLEQLVREQLATGRFQDASEVVAAALRLLGERSHAREVPPNYAPAMDVPPDYAFGLWKGRFADGLTYERSLRAEWGE